MPWQKRGKHEYYYSWRTRSSGRKKVYFGRGPAASVVALRDQIKAAEHRAACSAFRAFRQQFEDNNERLKEAHGLITHLVAAEMIAAGYYRHDRGRWRKRRR